MAREEARIILKRHTLRWSLGTVLAMFVLAFASSAKGGRGAASAARPPVPPAISSIERIQFSSPVTSLTAGPKAGDLAILLAGGAVVVFKRGAVTLRTRPLRPGVTKIAWVSGTDWLLLGRGSPVHPYSLLWIPTDRLLSLPTCVGATGAQALRDAVAWTCGTRLYVLRLRDDSTLALHAVVYRLRLPSARPTRSMTVDPSLGWVAIVPRRGTVSYVLLRTGALTTTGILASPSAHVAWSADGSLAVAVRETVSVLRPGLGVVSAGRFPGQVIDRLEWLPNGNGVLVVTQGSQGAQSNLIRVYVVEKGYKTVRAARGYFGSALGLSDGGAFLWTQETDAAATASGGVVLRAISLPVNTSVPTAPPAIVAQRPAVGLRPVMVPAVPRGMMTAGPDPVAFDPVDSHAVAIAYPASLSTAKSPEASLLEVSTNSGASWKQFALGSISGCRLASKIAAMAWLGNHLVVASSGAALAELAGSSWTSLVGPVSCSAQGGLPLPEALSLGPFGRWAISMDVSISSAVNPWIALGSGSTRTIDGHARGQVWAVRGGYVLWGALGTGARAERAAGLYYSASGRTWKAEPFPGYFGSDVFTTDGSAFYIYYRGNGSTPGLWQSGSPLGPWRLMAVLPSTWWESLWASTGALFMQEGPSILLMSENGGLTWQRLALPVVPGRVAKSISVAPSGRSVWASYYVDGLRLVLAHGNTAQ